MAIQIVMDRTGDSRHAFNPRDAQERAKAEQRFYELRKSASPQRSGPVQVRSRRSDHSTPAPKKPCSFPDSSAGSRPLGHVRLSTLAVRWQLSQESDAGPLHEARRRAHARRPVAAALAGMAVAGAARAARQARLFRGCWKRQWKALQDSRRRLSECVRGRRERPSAAGVVLHADRRSADRRRYACPKDRAGNMRTRGARRSQEVRSERFPFQANPTSRLTAQAVVAARNPSYADLRLQLTASVDRHPAFPSYSSLSDFSP
jgi:hypothetical protein